MIILKGNGFILRPSKLSDAENIFKFQQDKELRRNFISYPKNINEVKKGLRRDFVDRKRSKNKRNGEVWTVDIDGEAVGQIGIYFHDNRNRRKIISYGWISKSYRGKGIMTQALKLVSNYVMREYNIVRLESHVRLYNKPSARILEKAGYVCEGILRKNQFKGGKFIDDYIYAKVR